MRAIAVSCLCLFGLVGACGPKEPPPPTEYIKFRYGLSTGPSSLDEPVVLPIDPGSLPCGRADQAINVVAKKGKIELEIGLRDIATRPAQWTANTATNGKVTVHLVVPAGEAPGSGTVGFFTGDPGDSFTCLLRVNPPDPFATFDASFTCDSKKTANGEVFIRDGLAFTNMCTSITN